MTKRWIAVTLASAFAVASAGAIAESPSSRLVSKAVQMSDAELDQVTAGTATSVIIINNPSGHPDAKMHGNHTKLMNVIPGVGSSITVTTGNGRTFTHCLGGGTC